MTTRRAFTIIELLVVIAIMAILLGLTVVFVANVRNRAKVIQARSEMAVIGKAAQTHFDIDKRYPKTMYEMQVIMGNGKTVDRYGSEFFATTDPWGTSYVYFPPPPPPINGKGKKGEYGAVASAQTAMWFNLEFGVSTYTFDYKRIGGVQILSAGPDKKFGSGGNWTPGTGCWASGQPGADDIANFSSKQLGQPYSPW